MTHDSLWLSKTGRRSCYSTRKGDRALSCDIEARSCLVVATPLCHKQYSPLASGTERRRERETESVTVSA